MKNFLYVDFLNLLYRCFYALPQMRSSQNIPTGGFYGVIKILKKTIEKYNIDTVIIFNDGEKSIRKKNYSFYKAQRQSTPKELLIQKKMLEEYFLKIGMPFITAEGYEADDGIYAATLYQQKNNLGKIFILSSDKDLHALLLLDNTVIIDSNKNDILDIVWLQKKYNPSITKEKILLYYSLCGDTSDNIPGIKGIGEKTAHHIASIYESLDDLYKDNFEKLTVSPRIKKLLIEGKTGAYDSLSLLSPLSYNESFFISAMEKKWDIDQFLLGNVLLKEYECFSLIEPEMTNNEKKIIPETEQYPYAKNLFTIRLCESLVDIEELQTSLKKASIIGLDTETNSGNPRLAIMVGFSLCMEKDTAWYVPLYTKGTQAPLYKEKLNLFALITSEKICIMHNALFDMHVIKRAETNVPEKVFDTMIAAHIFREKKIGLKDLSLTILKEKMNSFSEIMQFGKYKTFDEVDLVEGASYAACDARQTYLMYMHYQELLKTEEFSSFNILFDLIEMPLIQVLFHIEYNGIYCDRNILIAEEIKYQKELENIKEQIQHIAQQHHFSLNPLSHKQTAFFLYQILHIPKQTKEKTDQKTLQYLAGDYPIIDLILKYRSIQSNINHFTTGLLKYIQPDNKIYTHYQQFITITGRITTMNPNLQNIPRNNDIYKIRSAFHSSEKYLLASFDYSQIELRVLAYLANDETLLSLFNNNADVHTLTASYLFDKPVNEITTEERQLAKKINFSIIYGLSAYNLAKELKITSTKAKEYIDIYKKTYPTIFSWMEKTIEKAKQNQFVSTLYGLKRAIPELQDSNKNILKSGERIAINTIIQGTAAEIMKKSMIAVYDYLKKTGNGKIVLQLHDEILVEIPETNTEKITEEIKKIMESIVDWSITLKVNKKIQKQW